MEEIEIDKLIAKRYGSIAGELMKAGRSGHLCMQKEAFVDGCTELKGDEERFEGVVGKWGNLYYLQRNWVLETEVVSNFMRLMKDVKPIDFGKKGVLNERQLKAVQMGLSQGVSCLTGGPGTGKSFVIGEIVKRFSGNVCVCAPTGKAVSLLRKKLNCEVGTLHETLGIKRGKDLLFKRGRLEYEMVIVDECSMIDVGLWAALFRSLNEKTRLVLVGDDDQLPPVEAGTIFGELCDYMKQIGRGYVHLNECMRSDRDEILKMAEAVKIGKMIRYQKLERKVENWKKEFKKGGFQILSCLRKGFFGVEAINESMWGGREIPIMITQTDKRMELNNGETGILIKKNKGDLIGKDDLAIFGERKLPAILLPEFEPSYCLSVHKSQGSEFDRVILFVPKGSEIFGREILYTAITRAKERIEVFADEGVIEKCLKNSGFIF